MTGLRPRDRRVLLVANNFPPVRGGSAAVYASLARCAGGRIIVLAPKVAYADGLPTIGWREHDRRASYRIDRLHLLRTSMPRTVPRGLGKLVFVLRDAALRFSVAAHIVGTILADGVRTVCIGELSASGWIAHMLAPFPGVRTVTYVHGEEITTEDFYDKDHARLHRALMRTDAIVVVSRFTQRAVAELLGGQAFAKTVLIENGVDNARFTPGAKADDLLELYGLRGRFVFVSVCRLLEKKGVDHALRAFAQMRETAPECRFLVVGTGPYRAVLDAMVAELDLAGHVVFAGQVADADLADHYRLGDVFVMPNRELPDGDTEGFGLVFLEANGCGLPVIAGCDGGSTDAVTDGVNGLVVDGHSVAAIADAMRRLVENEALRGTLARQGLQVAQAAGWEGKTSSFLKVCETNPTLPS